MRAMYVTPDPSSLKAAEDREHREQLAASAVLSITRISAEELRRAEFWKAVAEQQAQPERRRERRLALVRR